MGGFDKGKILKNGIVSGWAFGLGSENFHILAQSVAIDRKQRLDDKSFAFSGKVLFVDYIVNRRKSRGPGPGGWYKGWSKSGFYHKKS